MSCVNDVVNMIFKQKHPVPHCMQITISPPTVDALFKTCTDLLISSLPILFPDKVHNGKISVGKLSYDDVKLIGKYFNSIGIELHICYKEPDKSTKNDLSKRLIFVSGPNAYIYFDYLCLYNNGHKCRY